MSKVVKARIIFSCVAGMLMSFVVSLLVVTKPANAAHNPFAEKWFLTAHYQCIYNGSAESNMSTNDKNTTIAELMYENNKGANQPLPSVDYFKAGDDKKTATCIEVLKGSTEWGIKDFDGIIQMASGGLKSNTTWDDKDAGPLVEKLGYNAGDTERDIEFFEANSTSANGKQNNQVNSGKANYWLHATPGFGGVKFEVKSNNGSTDTVGDIKLNLSGNDLTVTYKNSQCQKNGDYSRTITLQPDKSIDDNIGLINNEIKNAGCAVLSTYASNGPFSNSYETTYSLRVESVASSGYSLSDDRGAAARGSIERLKGGLQVNDAIKIEDLEYYNLFNWYISNNIQGYNPNPISSGALSCQKSNGSAKEIHLKSGGVWYKYYLDTSKADFETRYWVPVVSDNHARFELWNMDQIIGWLGWHEAKDAPEGNCPVPDGAEQIKATVTADDACYKSAESLGWIVCPIIKGVGSAIEEFYTGVVEDLISINVSAFNQEEGAYKAWQVFQSFANVIFVILFLVVIISQITGVGIDNLGIKRILPKLIVAAILVNLSYIICMLLVDVSNIAGSGFYRLFDGVDLSSPGGLTSGKAGVTTLLTGLGLGAAGAAGIVAIFWIPGTVPAILLGLISILISLITMFILLGVYQAGVIIAVVVSPVAFVMYMLPNTKNIFDRWKKLFQALLLLYPICGLMMGGAAFASKILLSVSSGSFWMSLLAALLSVIPFFFIPKVLKSSMAAMGNIGNKISGIGKGISGKATGAVSNSGAFQDWQARRAAGVDRNGNLTGRGELMRSLAKGRVGKDGKRKKGIIARAATRQLARGQNAYDKREGEIIKGETNLDPSRIAANKLAQEKAVEREALTAEMAVINDKTRNGEDEEMMNQLYDEAVAGGNVRRARAIAEIAGRRKDTASRFLDKLKEDSTNGMYDSDDAKELLKGVSKQIATGEGSKNYRAGNATGFEFAAQTNSGKNTEFNYSNWSADAQNIKDAIDHHITNPNELVGQTRKTLHELSGAENKAFGRAAVNDDSKKYLSELAKYAEEQRKVGGAYDQTKTKELNALRDLYDGGASGSNPGDAPENSGSGGNDSGSSNWTTDASGNRVSKDGKTIYLK